MPSSGSQFGVREEPEAPQSVMRQAGSGIRAPRSARCDPFSGARCTRSSRRPKTE